MSNLIEIDRVKVIDMGGTLYSRVPKFFRRNGGVSPGDEAVFLRDVESGEVVIRIEKVLDESGNPKDSAAS